MEFEYIQGRLGVTRLDLAGLAPHERIVPSTGTDVLDYAVALATAYTRVDNDFRRITLTGFTELPDLVTIAKAVAVDGSTVVQAFRQTRTYSTFQRLMDGIGTLKIDLVGITEVRKVTFEELCQRARRADLVEDADEATRARKVPDLLDVNMVISARR